MLAVSVIMTSDHFQHRVGLVN